MTADYDAGNRDMRFLKAFIQRKDNQRLDITPEFMEFSRIFPLDELTKDVHFTYGNVKIKYGSLEFQRLEKMRAANGKSSNAIGYILLASVNAIMDTAVKRRDAALMERMLNEMPALDITNQKVDYLRIEFFQKIEDWNTAFTYTDTYMRQYLLSETVKSIRKRDSASYQNGMQLYLTGKKDSLADKEGFEFHKMIYTNSQARLISSQITQLIIPIAIKVQNKTDLKTMLTWSARALELEPEFFTSLQAHALVLYKNGETNKAISLYSKAIEKADKISAKNDSEKLNENVVLMKEQFEKMKKGIL